MAGSSLRRTAPAYWLALLRAPAGSRALCTLLQFFETPEAIFEAGETAWRQAGLPAEALGYFRNPDWNGVDQDLCWLDQAGNHLVTLQDGNYPALLKGIADPPVALLLRGDPQVLACPQLAIVGSRSATPAGCRIAHAFASELAALGLTVTSGLATGIDSHAHRGAMDAGGRTVAVLGNGLDSVYPRQNLGLAEAVSRSGALVSEFPTGTAAIATNFPRRNRIISGLSVGTLVVEAARRSGSLITARLALEQGREVFAVPGSIRNPVAQGCHELLRQGATLVEKIEDMLEQIPSLLALANGVTRAATLADASSAGLDGSAKLLLDNIGDAPVHIDSLIEYTDLPAGVAASALSSLEIAGLVESLPGGRYIRR